MSGEPLLLHGCPALPRPAPLINGVEHANFFETRATQYSKAATRGNWNDVWASFDARPKAKKGEAANEVRASDCSGFSSEGIAVPRASDCVCTGVLSLRGSPAVSGDSIIF